MSDKLEKDLERRRSGWFKIHGLQLLDFCEGRRNQEMVGRLIIEVLYLEKYCEQGSAEVDREEMGDPSFLRVT